MLPITENIGPAAKSIIYTPTLRHTDEDIAEGVKKNKTTDDNDNDYEADDEINTSGEDS